MPATYGTEIERSIYRPDAHVIVMDGTSHAGNVILRAGSTHAEGWTQSLHIVLTPTEARAFAAEVLAALDADR